MSPLVGAVAVGVTASDGSLMPTHRYGGQCGMGTPCPHISAGHVTLWHWCLCHFWATPWLLGLGCNCCGHHSIPRGLLTPVHPCQPMPTCALAVQCCPQGVHLAPRSGATGHYSQSPASEPIHEEVGERITHSLLFPSVPRVQPHPGMGARVPPLAPQEHTVPILLACVVEDDAGS